MAIVYSYPQGTPTISDTVLGTQFDYDGNPTKSFLISDIANLVASIIPQGVDSVFGRAGNVIAINGDYTTSLVTEGTNLYYTDTRARAAISLIVAGTSGASTYNNTTGVLTIPNYATGGIAWLESNATDLTVWNNGKNNIGTNTSFGEGTLKSNTTGQYNTGFGYRAIYANTIGEFNTALGWLTLTNNTEGTRNVAVGGALNQNTTGSNNVGVGLSSLNQNITGSNNTAIGRTSLFSISSGSNNTAIGNEAGKFSNTASNNNVYIGALSGPEFPTIENNKLYISLGSGTPLIGGDFSNRIVTIDQVLVLTPTIDPPIFPGGAVNGMIAVYGAGAAQHIYCYINGAWKQLDN